MLTMRTFAIHRLESSDDESGTHGIEFDDTERIISGYLENASAEFTAIVDGEFGKTFRLFSDDFLADVQIGDRLVDSTGPYDVKGKQATIEGPGRRLELTLILAVDQ